MLLPIRPKSHTGVVTINVAHKKSTLFFTFAGNRQASQRFSQRSGELGENGSSAR